MLRLLALLTALLIEPNAARAQEQQSGSQVGDVFEVRVESTWSRTSSDESSGESHSRSVLVERVVAVHAGGVEVEFDLPDDASAQDRAREWQFPVRILRPPHGPLQLLNRPELERRLAAWLQRAGLPREACGRWYFTWNAFQIQCDPEAVVETIAGADLPSHRVGDGALHDEPGARGRAVLTREAAGPDGATIAARMEVDPEAVRRERAQADLVVAEIMREPTPTLEAALQARSAERISGTIRISFETDAAGNVRRRTKVTEIRTEKPDGVTGSETSTEVVERRLVSRRRQ